MGEFNYFETNEDHLPHQKVGEMNDDIAKSGSDVPVSQVVWNKLARFQVNAHNQLVFRPDGAVKVVHSDSNEYGWALPPSAVRDRG